MPSRWLCRYTGPLTAVLLTPLLLGAQERPRDVEATILYSHNQERLALGLEPMRWNTDLAAGAKKWADHLIRTRRFEHSAQRGARPLGENLWAGTAGAFRPETMVGHWLSEKRYFKPGRFPAVSRTGRASDVGHYTQIIWRDSTRLGCAISRSVSQEVLVCRYDAPGNVIGERPI